METRNLIIKGAELRAQADYVIVGKALSYNKVSPDDSLRPGVREKIAPGCFAGTISGNGDVKCLLNHDPSKILGRRANGSLQLIDSPDALRFRCQLDKNNPDHAGSYASIRSGLLDECSFQFMVEDQDWLDDTDSKGQPCTTRVVKRAQLLDVSIVTFPFYSTPGSTSAEARSKKEQRVARLTPEVIATYRKVTRSMTPKLFVRDGAVGGADGGDEMALVRGHLEQCHQMLECAFASSDTARSIMDSWAWDDDDEEDSRSKRAKKGSPYAPYGDPDDCRAFRELHQKAHAAMQACCEQMARCRLSQPAKK